jgi:tetratricopeptide (TPR) repeat protein
MNARLSAALSTAMLLLLSAQALAVPDGPISAAAPVTAVAPDAAMQARLDYNLGYEQFEQVQAAELAAQALGGAKAKAAAKATLEGYAQARLKFEAAAKGDPSVKEAWNMIGYTSRRLADYDRSLAAYEKALELNPAYSEAIEYRAEAYLALNRLDDVKTAYMTLFLTSRAHAGVLMQGMQKWVAEHRRQRAGVAAADLDGFAQWVQDRAAVAQQTVSLGPDQTAVRRWD